MLDYGEVIAQGIIGIGNTFNKLNLASKWILPYNSIPK